MTKGIAMMEDHETRRKIIRQWRSLPKDKRQTSEQAVAFARKAVEENKFGHSRRDPYQRIIGWLLPRTLSNAEPCGKPVAGLRTKMAN